MAEAADCGEGSALPPPRNPVDIPAGVLEGLPWVDDAIRRAQFLKEAVDDAAGTALRGARSRLFEMQSTASAHFRQTVVTFLDAFEGVPVMCAGYEDAAFGKIKEGMMIAASYPTISCGIAAGVGVFGFRGTRHYFTRNMLRLFVSKESLLSSAENKVKVLRQSIDVMKLEKQKLEERALMAKSQMNWGTEELRKASNQIQGVIHSVYNIEKLSRSLKTLFTEFPGAEAYQFRSKLSSLPTQVKQEKKALHKVISRIRNHGILT